MLFNYVNNWKPKKIFSGIRSVLMDTKNLLFENDLKIKK